MNITVSFYDPGTGLFVGRQFSGTPAQIERNTPEGLLALPGEFDHLSQRVDLDAGTVVDYQPPRPSSDHEWNSDAKRWQLSAAALAAITADQQARAVILATEEASARTLREGLLELLPKSSPVRTRLQQADDAIVAQRQSLKLNPGK